MLPEMRVTLIYFTIGIVWILFSDTLLFNLSATREILGVVTNFNRILFVFITTFLLFVLIQREFHQRRHQHDINDQKDKNYRYLFLNNPQPMAVFNIDTLRFLEVNDAARHLYGYTHAEFLTMTIKDIRASEDVANLTPTHSLSNHKNYISEGKHRLKNGQIIDVEVHGHGIVFENNNASLILVRNITTYKIAQRDAAEKERLQLALSKEVELRELRNRFMSMVSHEFRNPLATVGSSVDILQGYSDRLSDERREFHFAKLKRQVKHLTGLLDDILMLTKAESITPEFKPHQLDLKRLCRDVVEDAAQVAGDKYTILAELPATPVEYMADEKLMRHAIANLVTNAVKYSPPGSVVRLSLCQSAANWQLQVCDEGMGIPEKDLKRLFEAFHRASNVGNIPGTGLGLAITKQAIELHGGRIDVVSSEGSGTTFTLYLPLDAAATVQ